MMDISFRNEQDDKSPSWLNMDEVRAATHFGDLKTITDNESQNVRQAQRFLPTLHLNIDEPKKIELTEPIKPSDHASSAKAFGDSLRALIGDQKEKTLPNGVRLEKQADGSIAISIAGGGKYLFNPNDNTVTQQRFSKEQKIEPLEMKSDGKGGIVIKDSAYETTSISKDGSVVTKTEQEDGSMHTRELPSHGKWRKDSAFLEKDNLDIVQTQYKDTEKPIELSDGSKITFGKGSIKVERDGNTYTLDANSPFTVTDKFGKKSSYLPKDGENVEGKPSSSRSDWYVKLPDGTIVNFASKEGVPPSVQLPAKDGVSYKIIANTTKNPPSVMEMRPRKK